jgi:pyruvate-ferredoxin/flavodoxin oxidoreductase
MRFGADQQKLAVTSGVWPLFRYDPRRIESGEPPLVIDLAPGRSSVEEYMRNETRFRMVEAIDAERFRRLAVAARVQSARRVSLYEQLAQITFQGAKKSDPQPQAAAVKPRETAR